MALVAAQEGRRVLDRFCGYMVSGPLSNSVGEKLSAGRVQSPAVRLVVEREKEIKAFSSLSHIEVCKTHHFVDVRHWFTTCSSAGCGYISIEF